MSAPAFARRSTAVLASKSSDGVVFNFPFVAVFCDCPAVAVAGVLAQADVGDEHELLCRAGLFQRAKSLLHDAIVGPGAGGLLVFRFRQAEEKQAADAELAASSASRTASSTERLKTPGMEPTGGECPLRGR